MKSEDKEAFEKWWDKLYSNHIEFRDWQGCDLAANGKEDMRYGWQAAIEYKQKEIDELQAENDRLKEVISYLPKVPTQPYEKELAQRTNK